jgi:hypothetical protein
MRGAWVRPWPQKQRNKGEKDWGQRPRVSSANDCDYLGECQVSLLLGWLLTAAILWIGESSYGSVVHERLSYYGIGA